MSVCRCTQCGLYQCVACVCVCVYICATLCVCLEYVSRMQSCMCGYVDVFPLLDQCTRFSLQLTALVSFLTCAHAFSDLPVHEEYLTDAGTSITRLTNTTARIQGWTTRVILYFSS
jgi:hypothetical protein